MKNDLKQYYIWLLSVMGAANPRTLRLISHFGGVREVYEALTDGAGGANNHEPAAFLKPWESKALRETNLDKAGELIDWCNKRGYGVVTLEDEDYPDSLKHIYNPPILLFTEGNLANFDNDIRINVIGTRNPSDYSCRVSAFLCGELARIGITIVSGMAVGIDKFSMSAALENRGRVAGVLACGIDVDYPRNSKAFRKTLAQSGGVSVSELLPRDSTRPAYFQQRNRIMAGLSSGTLIVEAADISGCHITALHTISQNRDLFCVPPHDITDTRYSGVSRYLRDGAIPVFSYIDIVNEYLSDVCERLSEPSSALQSATPKQLEKLKSTATSSAKPKPKAQAQVKPGEIEFKKAKLTVQTPPRADFSQVGEVQARIIEALRKKKLTFDELISPKRKLLEADKAAEILLDMELDGLITKIAGDRYAVDN